MEMNIQLPWSTPLLLFQSIKSLEICAFEFRFNPLGTKLCYILNYSFSFCSYRLFHIYMFYYELNIYLYSLIVHVLFYFVFTDCIFVGLFVGQFEMRLYDMQGIYNIRE